MNRVATHINDAGIVVLDGPQILYREPGFALLEDHQITTGSGAFRHARINPRRIQHRYWAELAVEPFADQRFAHLSAADLVSGQLEQMSRAAGGSEMIVAVPAYMSSQQLGLLLGIATEINCRIVAMVDAAVAATRREYQGAVPVHIDVSLHSATLTRLAQPGCAQVERVEVLPGNGSYALFDTWLNAIAEAFVSQSRFDPLHTAETEQLLVNNMAGWLSEAARNDQVYLDIEFGGSQYAAQIDSLSLIGAAAPVYQSIANKLRALFRADEVPAVQLTDRVARLPGLADMLKARVGGEIFVLEPGATARGALARCRDPSSTVAGVSLMRQLPWDQAAVPLAGDFTNRTQKGVPSHMLFGNTAYEIGNSPLILGSEDTGNQRLVMPDADMPGVSRQHCSLVRLNGQCVLEDHSRYGTFLNGHRIDGSAVLQIGDSVRIGSPGFEFLLITTDETNG